MSPATRALVVAVCVFHVAAFVVEAFLWMQPGIHEFALDRISDPSPLALHDRALVLRALFVNQGFYNLFLSGAGFAGLLLAKRGHVQAAYALILYMCLSAVGAGLVLSLTTRAYAGAFLQAAPAALALARMLPLARSAA